MREKVEREARDVEFRAMIAQSLGALSQFVLAVAQKKR